MRAQMLDTYVDSSAPCPDLELDNVLVRALWPDGAAKVHGVRATPLPESDLSRDLPLAGVIVGVRVAAPTVATTAALVSAIRLVLSAVAVDYLRHAVCVCVCVCQPLWRLVS